MTDENKAMQAYSPEMMSLAEVGEEVWDASGKAKRTVTAEMLARFTENYNAIFYSQLITADKLAAIYRERDYVVPRCHSWSEFVEKYLPFSERQAQRMIRLGEAKWLLMNTLTNLGMSEERVQQIGQEVSPRPKGIHLALLKLPPEEAAKAITETWISPDGKEFTAAEVLDKIGGDLHGKLKEEHKGRKDLEAKVKTLEDENEGLLKIAKGDTTVAADLAQKLDHTQKRLEEVIGTRESGERAKKEFAEAEKKLLDAHDVLLKYMPRGEDEEEWLKHGDEFGMSASLSQQFADRFMKISRTYIKFREAYEG